MEGFLLRFLRVQIFLRSPEEKRREEKRREEKEEIRNY